MSTTTKYTTAGTATWTAPSNGSVQVRVWQGGAGGRNGSAGNGRNGAPGGAAAQKTTYPVLAEDTIAVLVGAKTLHSASAPANGGNSSATYNPGGANVLLCLATGGTSGAGMTGDIQVAGNFGGASGTGIGGGGGGAGAALDSSDGTGKDATTATGGLGGATSTSPAGNGGQGGAVSGAAGANGVQPGGGGGGGASGTGNGGDGADGEVDIIFTPPIPIGVNSGEGVFFPNAAVDPIVSGAGVFAPEF